MMLTYIDLIQKQGQNTLSDKETIGSVLLDQTLFKSEHTHRSLSKRHDI